MAVIVTANHPALFLSVALARSARAPVSPIEIETPKMEFGHGSRPWGPARMEGNRVGFGKEKKGVGGNARRKRSQRHSQVASRPHSQPCLARCTAPCAASCPATRG